MLDCLSGLRCSVCACSPDSGSIPCLSECNLYGTVGIIAMLIPGCDSDRVLLRSVSTCAHARELEMLLNAFSSLHQQQLRVGNRVLHL